MRVNPDLKEDIGLDAVDKIETLLRVADQVDLTDTFTWIDQRWQS